jgi:predicted acylesterase/phospholipase RssA
MLELSLPGGGLWGIGLCGFLMALRERKCIPRVVSGISSGNHAAYLAYSNADYNKAIEWFQTIRAYLVSKPVRRFLPPYDMKGEHISSFTLPYMVDNTVLREMGLEHFYVGYVSLGSLKFIAEDVMPYSKLEVCRTILKSSTIPFFTNFVPHFEGAVDGGFRTNNFTSPIPTEEKWMISYAHGNRISFDRKLYKRRIVLPKSQGSALRMNDNAMRATFERGYEFGATLRGI